MSVHTASASRRVVDHVEVWPGVVGVVELLPEYAMIAWFGFVVSTEIATGARDGCRSCRSA